MLKASIRDGETGRRKRRKPAIATAFTSAIGSLRRPRGYRWQPGSRQQLGVKSTVPATGDPRVSLADWHLCREKRSSRRWLVGRSRTGSSDRAGFTGSAKLAGFRDDVSSARMLGQAARAERPTVQGEARTRRKSRKSAWLRLGRSEVVVSFAPGSVQQRSIPPGIAAGIVCRRPRRAHRRHHPARLAQVPRRIIINCDFKSVLFSDRKAASKSQRRGLREYHRRPRLSSTSGRWRGRMPPAAPRQQTQRSLRSSAVTWVVRVLGDGRASRHKARAVATGSRRPAVPRSSPQSHCGRVRFRAVRSLRAHRAADAHARSEACPLRQTIVDQLRVGALRLPRETCRRSKDLPEIGNHSRSVRTHQR